MSVLSLALITGCGGNSDDSKGSGSKDSSSSTAAAKALSAAELKKLIISGADLDGYDVKSADTGGVPPLERSREWGSAPLACVLTGFAPGDTSAYVNRMATEKSDKPTPTGTSDKDLDAAMNGLQDVQESKLTIVSLSSYDGGGAQDTMKSVSDAVSGCANGFTVSAKGQDTQKFTKVAEEKSSGSDDASVAFAVTGKADGDTTTVHAEVVRHDKYGVPAEIVKAQAAKLAQS
ncbi:hypothetical protein ACFY1U_07950 [Streptomyces sp. NPDC001351]|uniref:hypothetical protein n=1 Tax=Streptomyces sp. NPDC001351 TaxID=3364564 RepID=UPI0036958697